MVVCPSCGKEQESKALCEDCGAALAVEYEKQSQSHPEHEEEVQVSEEKSTDAKGNEAVEKAKDIGLGYWQFVRGSLARPSDYFDDREHNLVNSLIHVVLFSLFIALASLLSIRKVMEPLALFLDRPGFGFFIGVFFLTIVYFAIITGLMFVANILFGELKSIKLIFNTYSALLTIPIVFAIFTFLITIFGMLKFGAFLIALSFFLVFGIVPLYIVAILFTKSANKIDSFIGVLAYKIVAIVIFAIVIQLLLNSILEDLLYNVFDIF